MVFRYSFPLGPYLLLLCEHSLYSFECAYRTLLPYLQPSGCSRYCKGLLFFIKHILLNITLLIIRWVEGWNIGAAWNKYSNRSQCSLAGGKQARNIFCSFSLVSLTMHSSGTIFFFWGEKGSHVRVVQLWQQCPSYFVLLLQRPIPDGYWPPGPFVASRDGPEQKFQAKFLSFKETPLHLVFKVMQLLNFLIISMQWSRQK